MNNKYYIPFIQFCLPHGDRKHTEIEVDEDTYNKYKEIKSCDLRMTVEILQNGMVSQCIEDPELGDFDCVISANGPNVPVKLKEMLMRFEIGKVEDWRDIMT